MRTQEKESRIWFIVTVLAMVLVVLAIAATMMVSDELPIARFFGVILIVTSLIAAAMFLARFLSASGGWSSSPPDALRRWTLLAASAGGVVGCVWMTIWVREFVGPHRPGLTLGMQVFGILMAILFAVLGIWGFTNRRPDC